jgi:hypothetical protein
MRPETATGLDSPLGSYVEAWFGLWEGAAILGRANLEVFASFWNLRRRHDHSLAALSQTMDGYMRSPRFLRLMKHSLKTMSWPGPFGPPTSLYAPAFASSKERPAHV